MSTSMIVITNQGDYELIPGTKTIKTSDHPVFQAQIEVHLAVQRWIGSPNSPTPLARFDRAKQSVIKVDEYRKELAFYLQKYSPEVQDAVVKRSNVVFGAVIAEDAFNG